MEKPNIQFIADMAHVSKATVSRVLNNSGPVKPETREKILDTIRRYNYTPSALAQGLSKQESSTIGIIVPEISNPFFGSIMRGVTEVADRHNLSLICFDSYEDVNKDIRAIEMFKRQRVRGLLYTAATTYTDPRESKRLLDAFSGFGAPVVLLDRKISCLDCGGVYFNDYESLYKAATILIKSGHKRIASINARRSKVLSENRQQGYEQALLDNGLPVDPKYEFFGEYTQQSGYELTKKMMAMEEPPTAVITFNNSLSKGFVKAITELKLKMPNDIQCIGLDRVEEFETVGISFNYIERDSYLMGIAGMEKILDPESVHTDSILASPVVVNQL